MYYFCLHKKINYYNIKTLTINIQIYKEKDEKDKYK